MNYAVILFFWSFVAHASLSTHFKLGIENTEDTIWAFLKGCKTKPAVGLITNQTGKDQQGMRTIDLLLQRDLYVKRMFAPEHGLHGSTHASHEVDDVVDAATRIPVISLYGNGTGKKLQAHTIADLDVLLFDMQDSGMRHYTYISTLLHCMKVAAQHDKPFVVLDRPNPLGHRMEGPISPHESTSFIAVAPIPLRHGMTIGELARYFNNHRLEKKVKLHVVKLKNFERTMGHPGDLLAPLSPHINSKQACFGYSFLGLLGEVRPFDTGLGTDKAMHCLALPEKIAFKTVQWKRLQALLKMHHLDSTIHSYYSPRKKQMCHGLLFQVVDINKTASFDVVLTILKFFNDAKIDLAFAPIFDTAIGTPKVQEYVKGTISYASLMASVKSDLMNFHAQVQASYLYHPQPSF